jgi:hypothetical protein
MGDSNSLWVTGAQELLRTSLVSIMINAVTATPVSTVADMAVMRAFTANTPVPDTWH